MQEVGMNVFGKKKDSEPGDSPTVTVQPPIAEEVPGSSTPTSRSMYPPFPEGPRAPRAVRPASGTAATTSPSSTLNSNLTFEGDLRFQGTVMIDCAFKGKITTEDSLVIGAAAKIQAELTAGSVEVSGKVQGNIHARQTVRILSGGEVYGNIETPTVSMAEGVIFEGTCTRLPGAPKPHPAPARPTASPSAHPAGEATAGVKPAPAAGSPTQNGSHQG
jgi:cytoskeletal protein CcmA (bactofilin family)